MNAQVLENKDLGGDAAAEPPVVEPAAQPDGDPRPQSATGGLPMEPAEQAVARLEGEVAELKDRHLRLAAEYDNFRRRATKERAELGDRAQGALAARLLDVLDDLDRVTNGGTGASGTDAVSQALVLIDKKLRKELEAAGLEKVDPAGQPFDPAVAEAISVLVPPSPDKDHTVSATFQMGYRFKGALIRPARVQVYSSEGHA